jgi:hypothetical protein
MVITGTEFVMSNSIANLPVRVERKPLKCEAVRTKEPFVRGGQLFDQARNACGYSQEQAAGYMGVSPGLLSRQATNQDGQHLSFQRICEMPPAFRRELAIGMLEDVDGCEVETIVRVRRIG